VQALREIMEAYAVEHFEREIVVAQGEQVAVMAAVRVRQRATQRCLRYRCADFMRFKDGRLIAFRHFINSFDVVEQALGRELAT
jgi:ketosteroid isomerase-like protein